MRDGHGDGRPGRDERDKCSLQKLYCRSLSLFEKVQVASSFFTFPFIHGHAWGCWLWARRPAHMDRRPHLGSECTAREPGRTWVLPATYAAARAARPASSEIRARGVQL